MAVVMNRWENTSQANHTNQYGPPILSQVWSGWPHTRIPCTFVRGSVLHTSSPCPKQLFAYFLAFLLYNSDTHHPRRTDIYYRGSKRGKQVQRNKMSNSAAHLCSAPCRADDGYFPSPNPPNSRLASLLFPSPLSVQSRSISF